jgi:CMP/dCMP kinase
MIVTIDGPAGSGKSTAAKGLARRLGFEYLDTGAMYRTVALLLHRANIPSGDAPAVVELLGRIKLEMPPGKVIVDGEDVTEAIRDPAISEGASRVAVEPHVRAMMVQLQRQIARGRNMVCEGRDQGSVVFTDSPCKFFLTAAVETRADRRFVELRARGVDTTLDRVLQDLQIRDHRDTHRAVAPLMCPPGAHIIQTDHMTPEAVLDHMEEVVRRCPPG